MKRIGLILVMLLSALRIDANATSPAPSEPMRAIEPAESKAVVGELGKRMQAHYVFPDVADRVAAALLAKEANGGYASARNRIRMAEALTMDLRTLGKDQHLEVMFDPSFKATPPSNDLPLDTVLDPDWVADVARNGYGIQSVERLPGNVGYLEVRGFFPIEAAAPALSAAMMLLSGTDALILDLRRNRGGSPDSVAHLLSHFFALGDERHLNDIYRRDDGSTRQYWTTSTVMPRYLKPIYVLTSKSTFSGGEECAYDLQAQKRAILVGETTGGGSNPGALFPLGYGFVAFIPTKRSINPITHGNWEHVGVKPDIAVAASKAKNTAYIAILRDLLAKVGTSGARHDLEEFLADAEAMHEKKYDPHDYRQSALQPYCWTTHQGP